MRPVSDLYGRHPNSDIYVLGTGASLRVFPARFLDDRITIGLNMAWKTVPVRYGITIHPDLNIPDFLEGSDQRPEITWIVKRGKMRGMPADQVRHAEERFYFFDNKPPDAEGQQATEEPGVNPSGRVTGWLRRPTDNFLYHWTSIAQPAVNLAVNMGATNVVLVGCDNAPLLGNHHAQQQHTRWLGAPAETRYHLYYEGLVEIRTVLRERGVNVVSLNPFLTLGPHDEDFLRLCHELEVPELLEGKDITRSYRPPWKGRRRDRARRFVQGRLRSVLHRRGSARDRRSTP